MAKSRPKTHLPPIITPQRREAELEAIAHFAKTKGISVLPNERKIAGDLDDLPYYLSRDSKNYHSRLGRPPVPKQYVIIKKEP